MRSRTTKRHGGDLVRAAEQKKPIWQKKAPHSMAPTIGRSGKGNAVETEERSGVGGERDEGLERSGRLGQGNCSA